MKKNIFYIFLLTTFIGGCKIGNLPQDRGIVDNTNTGQRSVQDHLLTHYNFFDQILTADGTVCLQAFSTFPMQNNLDYSDAIAMASLEKEKISIEGVRIENILLPKIRDGHFRTKDVLQGGVPLRHLYGQNVNISLNYKDNSTSILSFYLPSMIKLDVITDIGFRFDLKAGAIIKWNADNKNLNGVVFIVEYDHSLNPASTQTGRVTKVFSSDDTGSYTIKQKDIEDLPKGANVNVTVGRAGFKTMPASGKVYTVFGFSVVALGATISK